MVNLVVCGTLLSMGIKSFMTQKLMERQLKNLPEGQRVAFMKMFKENPELFEKIGEEIKQKKKEGQDEMLASVFVMKKYESQIRALLMKKK